MNKPKLINDIYSVQPYGSLGLSLTLPAKYAKRNNLTRGSSVHIEELENGQLIVTPIPPEAT